MRVIRDNSPEAVLGKIEVFSELLMRIAQDKKFSDSDDVSIFQLGVFSLHHMLIENRHAEAIDQFIKLLRSNGDRHGS